MERGRMSRLTSSRMSELPMRVQDSSMRRTSFFGARTSGASMPRNSTMSGFGATEKIKDSRPLHDKSFVQQCVRQLHEIKWSLSKQELLFSDFCEDGSNIEEGAEYNKVVEYLSINILMRKHFTDKCIELFLDYTAETYSKFMQGDDTFESEDETFLTKLKKRYNVDETLLSAMEEKHRILSDKVERLEKERRSDRLMTKRMERMERMKLHTDLKQLHTYRSSLESFNANLENKASELNNDLENTACHLESLKHERNELQRQLQNQKFTPADVERINREKRELQQTISSLSKSLEDAEQHKWNEEITLAKVQEKAELRLLEYKLARKLKLIPLSAENACGHDFEIRPFECGSGTVVQHKAQIQMLLRKLISDVEEESSRLANMKLNLEESSEQKCLEDLHSRVQHVCFKAVEEDEAAVQKLRETLKSVVSKANGL